MSKPTRPALSLSTPDDFIKAAPATKSAVPRPSQMPRAEPSTPQRGHVIQASGRIVRRLVVNVPVEIGVELEKRSELTGASLSRITTDLLRTALAASQGA